MVYELMISEGSSMVALQAIFWKETVVLAELSPFESKHMSSTGEFKNPANSSSCKSIVR